MYLLFYKRRRNGKIIVLYYLVEKLGAGVMERVRLRGYAAYEAINFADGRRSIFNIAQALAAEYGPQNIGDVAEFFGILAEAGLFSLKK